MGSVDSGEAGLLRSEAEAVEVGTEFEGHEKTLDPRSCRARIRAGARNVWSSSCVRDR